MDPAGHINNSHYWVPLEEELASGPEPDSIDAEVEYRDPAVAGEAVLLRRGSAMWIASPDGAVHASLQRS
jgi:acyl-ACP thioesterase